MQTNTRSRINLWNYSPGQLLGLSAALLALPLALPAAAALNVTPASRDFGLVRVGLSADRSFTVENTGEGTLTGAATASAPFSVVSGSPYALGAHASTTVIVRFSPTAEGTSTQHVSFTGDEGATRLVTGFGYVVVHYVYRDSANPVSPFLSWATAATNIQDAVDTAQAGDVVLVANGLYDAGGRPGAGLATTNRVAIDRAITVQSLNGPGATILDGAGTVRCTYVGTNARLNGFTLTNGYGLYAEPDAGGGGAWCEASAVVSNCVLAGNWGGVAGGAVRGGVLYACTLTNNLARSGGGAYGATLYDCSVLGNIGWRRSGGVGSSTLYRCELVGNSADQEGGGAGDSVLYDCILAGNSAEDGGGAAYSQLYHCTLTNNRCGRDGGGASLSMLSNCLVRANEAAFGGGVWSSTVYRSVLAGNAAYASGGGAGGSSELHQCVLATNSADFGGGGASGGTLYGCALLGNSAFSIYYVGGDPNPHYDGNGGGISGSSLDGCTLAGNDAGASGGGARSGSLYNSIIWSNTAPSAPNCSDSLLSYCCTVPLPASGSGNIEQDPGFVNPAAGDFHLQAGSPCINAGTNQDWMVGATDLEGNPRVSYGTVDMGAFEFFTPSNLVANMLLPRCGPGAVQVRFAGVVGRSYSLQRAPALPGPWLTIGSVQVNLVGIGSLEDPGPPSTNAFYRASDP